MYEPTFHKNLPLIYMLTYMLSHDTWSAEVNDSHTHLTKRLRHWDGILRLPVCICLWAACCQAKRSVVISTPDKFCGLLIQRILRLKLQQNKNPAIRDVQLVSQYSTRYGHKDYGYKLVELLSQLRGLNCWCTTFVPFPVQLQRSVEIDCRSINRLYMHFLGRKVILDAKLFKAFFHFQDYLRPSGRLLSKVLEVHCVRKPQNKFQSSVLGWTVHTINSESFFPVLRLAGDISGERTKQKPH